MKILVMSDTHGDIDKAVKIMKRNRDADLVIHLGDYFRDAEKLAAMFPDMKMEYVYGNSDFMIGNVPGEKLLEFKGKRILITHGHRYSVKWNYDKLHQKAQDMKLDLLLFGHTHVPALISKNGYTLLNPGSMTESRGNTDESYAIIKIGSDIDSKLYYV